MTVADIKKTMTDKWISQPAVAKKYSLESGKSFDEQFSAVSLENIIFSIVAAVYWALACLFDLHKKEINDIVDAKEPHTPRWYANTCKQYQHGYTLPSDSHVYDNAGRNPDDVEASRIVAHAAVVEQPEVLDIKVAKVKGDALAALDDIELRGFVAYMARVKDAGVELNIISKPADNLRLTLEIYYDPLILKPDGARIDGTSQQPVVDAIRAFLKNMPFNGVLVLNYLVDALQAVEGVIIPDLQECYYKYGGMDFKPVNVQYLPYSGYFVAEDNDLYITYTPQSPITT